ncbi:NS7d protein [Pigeon coronavirus UAE-HKU29]|nr:NS7d protein [Pigeon coronavirus UAE-HKU29]
MLEQVVYWISYLVLWVISGYPTVNEAAQLFAIASSLWFLDVAVLLPLTYLFIEEYDLHYIPRHIV